MAYRENRFNVTSIEWRHKLYTVCGLENQPLNKHKSWSVFNQMFIVYAFELLEILTILWFENTELMCWLAVL